MNASGDPVVELSAAKAHLARLQRHQEVCRRDPASNDHDATSPNNSAAESLFLRAREAEDRIELLSLNRHVVNLVNDIVAKKKTCQQRDKNAADAAAGVAAVEVGGGQDATSSSSSLAKATETCTALGLLLLQHDKSHKNNNNGESGKFHAALVDWYDSLHGATRSLALDVFRTQLRKTAPEYPSNERSSILVADALRSSASSSSSSFANNESRVWNVAARCLVELQVIYDALQLVLLRRQRETGQAEGPEDASQQQKNQHQLLPPSWRLDIVDELCRPLAERLRFHFLEEQTGIMAGGTEEQQSTHHRAQQTSTMDRLPEWLFRYFREVVDNHGVYSLVMRDGVQSLVDSVMDSLVVSASMVMEDEGSFSFDQHDVPEYDGGRGGPFDAEFDDAGTKTHGAMQQLRHLHYNHSSVYFLREVARMARHALRAKSFFHHPDVVGSECRDRTIALRGIEQLFLFDSFMDERIKEGGAFWSTSDRGIAPPRMVDTFLSSNEFLLQWWLEEERDGIISSLRQCAVTTLSSYLSHKEEDGPDEGMETSAGATTQQQLYPPISELFVALLHSARCKSNIFLDQRSRQMYLANVIAPLCSEYLDMVHSEAASLRKKMLARPPISGPGVSVLRSANLPSNELLTSNTMDWASLITGTHLAAQAVLGSEERQDSHNDVLDRVGESMERLCDAMVEEFTSAYVETIIMERAKLASYMMRAPFLLSEPPSPERRGQRDKDKCDDSLSLSPDLNDSIHVVSLGVQACNATMRKVRDMFRTDDDDNGKAVEPSNAIEPNAMLYFGSRSIHEALKFAISQKLLDIAIDPQGMTPEIYLGGAQQFQYDVASFERLFRAGGGGAAKEADNTIEPGPTERVVAGSHLMSLEPSQIQTIRDALRALAVPSSGIGSLFGRRGDESAVGECNSVVGDEAGTPLNIDDFYSDDRLMEEANNMLEAKGFAALSLNESLSIINRRC